MSSVSTICKFFATTSGCKFGENCQYLHSETTSISFIQPERDKDHGAVRSKTRESEQGGSVVSESQQSAETTIQDDTRKVCVFFVKSGRCRYGERCRFSHALKFDQRRDQGKTNEVHLGSAEKDRTSDQDGGRRRGWGGEGEEEGALVRGENPPPLDAIDPGNEDDEAEEFMHRDARKLCSFFARTGCCRFGARCRFSHALTPGQPRGPLKTYEAQNQVAESGLEGDTEGQVASEDFPSQSHDEEGVNTHETIVESKQQGRSKQIPRRLCRYFRNGGCSMGRRCRFWHPDDLLKGPADETCTTSSSILTNPVVMATQTSGHDGEARRPTPRKRRPLPKMQPTLRVLEELSEEDLVRLRQTEIDQLKKRFPKERLSVIEGNPERYLVVFSPTDPDWPYDVRSLQLVVYFPYKYPVRRMIIKISEEQKLPDALERHIWWSMRDWIKDRHAALLEGGQVELAFRQFLRWLDRNAEEIFTDGLRQVQREIMAKQAGIEIIPVYKLRGAHNMDTDSSDEEEEEEEEEVDEEYGNSGDSDEDEECDELEEEEYYDSEEEVDEDEVERKLGLDPVRRGTEVRLKNLQLTQSSATLLTNKLNIVIQCGRCKNRCDVKTPGERVNVVACAKCHSEQYLTFHPAMAHQFSSVLGYLDLQGCVAFDLILPDCDFNLGCLNCSREVAVGGIQPGQVKDTWCKSCHSKMGMGADTVKFHNLQAGNEIDTDEAHVVKLKKLVRSVKDPSIREGFPLPDNGTCKHYRKSFRWLRFPCCGKAYPCDFCHDDKEDHEMKFANRMICGHCSKEQFYSPDRPCKSCDASMTKVKTSHWEGGKGCRDKISMSRDDNKKYSNGHKTVSRKAAAKAQPKKKKVTKLRHT